MHTWGDWGGNYYGGVGAAGFMAEHPWVLALLAFLLPFIILVVFWALFWKGLSLWHAARRGQYWWFMILLVVNTLGILEIIYLFFVAKLKWSQLFSLHSDTHHQHHDGHH